MDNSVFNRYSSPFAWVTPFCVAEVYEEAARHLNGAIVDCGCGPCKLAPYLVENREVLGYLGVDYSPEMVGLGQQLLEKLDDPRFQVQCASVEDIEGEFDCAVSLQSYYAWPNPYRALQRIYDTLVPGGKLVLATINQYLDIDALLKSASRDWLLNPQWCEYETHNRLIVNSLQDQLDDIDKLISVIKSVGFELQEAHTRHYNGGLSFVVLNRPGIVRG